MDSSHEHCVLGSIVSQPLGLAVSCGTSCHVASVTLERLEYHMKYSCLQYPGYTCCDPEPFHNLTSQHLARSDFPHSVGHSSPRPQMKMLTKLPKNTMARQPFGWLWVGLGYDSQDHFLLLMLFMEVTQFPS